MPLLVDNAVVVVVVGVDVTVCIVFVDADVIACVVIISPPSCSDLHALILRKTNPLTTPTAPKYAMLIATMRIIILNDR